MGFFRSSKHSSKHKEAQPQTLGDLVDSDILPTSLLMLGAYDEEYISKVTRIPSYNDYENPSFARKFNSQDTTTIRTRTAGIPVKQVDDYDDKYRTIRGFKINEQVHREDFEEDQEPDEEREEQADVHEEANTTPTTTSEPKPLGKRGSFFALFSRSRAAIDPLNKVEESFATTTEDPIEIEHSTEDLISEMVELNDVSFTYSRDTEAHTEPVTETETETAPEPRRGTIRSFFRRSNTSCKKDRLRLRDRLFRKVPAKAEEENSTVYDVQETLTQRYMGNNYATLLDDLEAVPFDLTVKISSDQQSLHSKLSKLVNVFTPVKNSIHSYSESPNFDSYYYDSESIYGNTMKLKSTRENLNDIETPYDVARRLKGLDAGSVKSKEVEATNNNNNNNISKFDLKPIEPVFGKLSRRLSKRLGFSANSHERELQKSPFIDRATVSTPSPPYSPKGMEILSNFAPIEYNCQSSPCATPVRSRKTTPPASSAPALAPTALDTGLTLVYDEGLVKKKLEEKNDLNQAAGDLYSGSTLFNSLFDTVPQSPIRSTQLAETTSNFIPRSLFLYEDNEDLEFRNMVLSLDKSAHSEAHIQLNSAELYLHPYESKSKKRFSLYSKPESISEKMLEDEACQTTDDFMTEILLNNKRSLEMLKIPKILKSGARSDCLLVNPQLSCGTSPRVLGLFDDFNVIKHSSPRIVS